MQDEPNRNPLNPYFVTGLVDGEGSFTYHWNYGNVTPIFIVAFNIGDIELLVKLQNFFSGVGTIYRKKPRSIKSGDITYISGEMAMYRVCQIDELLIVRQHFTRYPLEGKKAKAFEIWDDMVVYKKFEQPGYLEMLKELALKLTIANGGKIKRTKHLGDQLS